MTREVVAAVVVVAITLLGFALVLLGCPSPSTGPSPVPPFDAFDVTITTTEAAPDPCALEQSVAAAHLIRLPDGGAYQAPDCGTPKTSSLWLSADADITISPTQGARAEDEKRFAASSHP